MRVLLAVFMLTCVCLTAVGQPPPVPDDARPLRPVPSVATVRPMSVEQFARTFQAVSGCARYEVVLLHPCTCEPVKLCFTLPGCPRRIKWSKTEIVFRYGLCKKPVVVTFCRDGGVQVQ